ncbi:MAG: dimethyl sulfoxide reductase anchor subunit family protein [Gammaproteobacteria bacterium]
MKPALSIVFFTVLSGGGLGLAAVLAVFADSVAAREFAFAVVLSCALTGGGLCASVFHLANPKNAWRAFSRVRTSWLSREAVCAVLFFALFMPWAAWHFYYGESPRFLRAAVLFFAVCAVFCTAMIYQSLKTIAAWHHPLTACGYLAFALQSGALLFAACASFGGGADETIAAAVCILTAAAVAIKILYYRRLGKTADIRVGRAAGFSRAGAKLLETGHAAQTFLTREFIFVVSARKLRALRIASVSLCAFAPPSGAAFALRGDSWGAVFAACFLCAGLLAERWLFFAEAKHSVRAYHGVGAP